MADSLNSFSEDVELHFRAVYWFLIGRVPDMDLAETLTQECFLKAYRRRSGFRGQSSVRTWLIRIP